MAIWKKTLELNINNQSKTFDNNINLNALIFIKLLCLGVQ